MKFLLVFFFFFASFFSYSSEYEFIGILKINKSTLISYRLVFTETNGIIKGYSITDLHGENETKNIITGRYNNNTGFFYFQEMEMEYTKSKVVKNDFCNISFEGKLKLSLTAKIKGKFNSYFLDKKPCISGEINLISQKRAENKLEKFDKKIQKSKKIKEEAKDSINLLKMLDELKINIIKKNDLTSVYFDSDEIFISIYDAGKEDGDKIDLKFNGHKVLSNYEIKNSEKVLKLQLKEQSSVLEIKSISDGTIYPNTTKIKIYNNSKTIELLTNLSQGDTTKIQFLKK